MDNLSIARILYEIAELMGLKQENKFKVRAAQGRGTGFRGT